MDRSSIGNLLPGESFRLASRALRQGQFILGPSFECETIPRMMETLPDGSVFVVDWQTFESSPIGNFLLAFS